MKSTLLSLALLAAALPAHAAGDARAGREKAAICAACHGENGIATVEGVPNLAGQKDQFLQWQLVFFRSGRRVNPAMAPLVERMTDADIRDLGAHYAALPAIAAPPPETDAALSARGRDIAKIHRCANCHTDSYLGERAAPSIANQREDYLVKALSDYRAAARPSTALAAMNEATADLNDEDIAALAHFLATLPATKPETPKPPQPKPARPGAKPAPR